MSDSATAAFTASGRFQTRQRLGGGGFGSVYEVLDTERDEIMALKVLERADPHGLYTFKQEFRTLATLRHPNLVRLYELFADGDVWYFTMELVRGDTFTGYLRRTDRARVPATSPTRIEHTPATTADFGDPPPADPLEHTAEAPAVPFDRVRAATVQLAEGVQALHAARVLHRDLKPSNVLVTPSGRVVLLDFGLVRGLSRDGEVEETVSRIVGTPAYMCPEQATGGLLTTASDWYSVGVMLYEALTGGRRPPPAIPFAGQKAPEGGTPRPSAIGRGVPDDLDQLAMDLLEHEPEARPDGDAVLDRLGGALTPVVVTSLARRDEVAPFVGRKAQLEALADAAAATDHGRAVVALVHARSGLGKTALVRRFLDRHRAAHRDTVLLAGRCYQRESVPFKVFDALVDDLARHLQSIKPVRAEAMLPADLQALLELFPVIGKVRVVEDTRRRVIASADRIEVRRRAFRALRELLTNLAARHPVVLFIDDLQWGDVDSAGLLESVLQPPGAPPLLLVGTYRSDEVEDSSFLRAWHASELVRVGAVDLREIPVEQLEDEEAHALVLELLGRDDEDAQVFAGAVVREARGHPLFVHQLVRFTEERAARSSEADLTLSSEIPQLDAVIRARVRSLPAPARRLLDVLAVAARPVERAVFGPAARLRPGEEDEAMTALAAATLVRARAADASLHLEPYHDRIREVVAAELAPADTTALHHRLAVALEATGAADPERMASHFQAAGEGERAWGHMVRAAQRAVDAMAFDRAARLYRTAFELDPARSETAEMRGALALALRNAGRGRDSAQEYRRAAALAEPQVAIEYRALAATQLLAAGYIEDGQKAIDEQLQILGMRLTPLDLWSTLGILVRLGLNWLRGLRWTPRKEAEVPREQLFRVDVLGTVADAMGMVSPPQAMRFQAWHLPAALDAGEPRRVARAIAIEIARHAAFGIARAGHVARLRRLQEHAAELDGGWYARCTLRLASSMASVYQGDWRDGYEGCVAAERYVLDNKGILASEFRLLWIGRSMSLLRLGRWTELAEYVPRLMAHLRERDDRYVETIVRAFAGHALQLRLDRPAAAIVDLDDALDAWPRRPYQLPHFAALVSRCEVLLYEGRPSEAAERIDAAWRDIKRSFFLEAQVLNVAAYSTRGRVRLACALELEPGAARRRLLAQARRDFRRTTRRAGAWPKANGALEMAAYQHARGDVERAAGLLGEAIEGLDSAYMSLHAAAARIARGRIVGGEVGAELLSVGEATMAAEGVANPDRLIAMWAPGLERAGR